jgi:fused signal recognition particle receptor
MAFGFIKKIFSFGDKKIEERPAEDAPADPAALPAPEAAPVPSPEPPVKGPVPDFLHRPEEEAAPEETPATSEPEISPAAEPRPVPEIPLEVPEPPRDPLPEPEPEPEPEPTAPHPPASTVSPKEGEKDQTATSTLPASAVPDAEDGATTPAPPASVAPGAEGETDSPASPSSSPSREEDKGEGWDTTLDRRGDEVAEPSPAAAPSPSRVTVTKAVERKAESAPPTPAPQPRPTWFQRLREGLSRSSRELTDSISGVFTKRKLDDDTLQDLEDVLIRADLGMETAIRITDALASGRYGKEVSDEEVRAVMAQEVEKVLTSVALPLELDLSHKPHVVLVVGVNGTGKTTTIGKLAAKLTAGGLKVTLAAGDTFRAAAIEQLKIWGERTGSEVVSSKLGADAAGLAYDAYEKAKENGSDVLVIDTAGRLQNRTELMAELEKIVRVLGKHDADAPHTVLQTVDATTGQNALNQVEIFRNVAGVNGLVMTKLDGTARGGILVAIAAKHKLPVYFIGVGEGIDDLEPFAAADFAKAIAGVN